MTTARKLIALLGVSAGVYALAVRPRMLRWGASDGEVRGPYPGDDVIPGGRRGATMAVTIAAGPSRLWPWLIQMGCDRDGSQREKMTLLRSRQAVRNRLADVCTGFRYSLIQCRKRYKRGTHACWWDSQEARCQSCPGVNARP